MIKMTTPSHQRTSQALAIVYLMCGLSTALAQTIVTDAANPPRAPAAAPNESSIQVERQNTLNRVNAVTADQIQSSDGAMQLGRTRASEGTALAPSYEAQNNTSRGASKARSSPLSAQGVDQAKSLLPTLPPLQTEAPSTQRLVKRLPPPLANEADAKPQFTPDFSRQKAQLSELAGRSTVSLPVLDLTVNSSSLDAALNSGSNPDKASWALADVINIGLAFSPVLTSSRAQFDVSNNRLGQARSDFFPTLSMRSTQGPETSSQNGGSAPDQHTYKTNSIRVTMPIYSRPIHQTFISAQKQSLSSELSVQATKELVALTLAKSAIDVATTRLNLDFSDEWYGQMDSILNYVEARSQSGATSQVDLERTRTRLLTAKQTRLDVQASYKTALFEMERLTGQVPAKLFLPALNELPGLPATKGEIRNLAKDQNADLRALRERVAAQQASVLAAQGRMLPTFGLSVESDRNSNVSSTSPETLNRRALVVLSWTGALGGRDVYAANEASAELRDRQAQLDAESQRIELAIEADFALLQSATLRITAGQSEQAAALRVADSVREQMKTGRLGSVLDGLDAFERLYAARGRVVQALGQQMQAQAQLLRWTGMLSQIQQNATLALAP